MSHSDAFSCRRKLRLQEQTIDPETLSARLLELPGMQRIDFRKNRILTLRYDASRLQFDQVLSVLEQLQLQPEPGRWQRFRFGWYRFVDENALSNSRRTDDHCCNKPPLVIRRKK